MSVLTHDVNAGGLACVQMYMEGTIWNVSSPLESILEHSIRCIALTRSARKFLGVRPSSALPQPAILNDNPVVLKLFSGESVAGTIPGSSTLLANCNIKHLNNGTVLFGQ